MSVSWSPGNDKLMRSVLEIHTKINLDMQFHNNGGCSHTYQVFMRTSMLLFDLKKKISHGNGNGPNTHSHLSGIKYIHILSA